MSTIKISELDSIATLESGDLFPVVDLSEGSTKKISASQLFPFKLFCPTGDTAGIDDPGMLTSLVSSVHNQGGGIVGLAPGTFYGVSPVTYQPVGSEGPRVLVVGSGRKATVWKNIGTGDAFRISWPGMPPGTGDTDFISGGLRDMTIDASSASGNAKGVHIGDGDGYELMNLHFTNFDTAGQAGLYFDNNVAWTEKLQAKCYFYNCAIGVLFDVTNANHSSFEYGDLTFFFNLRNTGAKGIVMQGGAYAMGTHLRIKGNFPQSGCVLSLSGNLPGKTNTFLSDCVLDLNCETAATVTPPQTIYFGGTNNTLHNCSGIMQFSAQPWTPSNANTTGQFTFSGPIDGDETLRACPRPSAYPASL